MSKLLLSIIGQGCKNLGSRKSCTQACKTASDCGAGYDCLCDGNCGYSCVKNGNKSFKWCHYYDIDDRLLV